MDRDAFEKLVAEWLDEPARPGLRRQIEQAVTETPALAEEWVAWTRLDQLVRDATLLPGGIDWQRVRTLTLAATSAQGKAQAAERASDLEQALAGLPTVAERVDWAKFRARTVAAIRGRGAGSRANLGPRRLRLIGGLLAAAAAVVLMVTLPPWQSQAPVATDADGFAMAMVTPAGHTHLPAATGYGTARITLIADDSGGAESPGTAAQTGPVVFLLVEPPVAGRATDDQYMFGFY